MFGLLILGVAFRIRVELRLGACRNKIPTCTFSGVRAVLRRGCRVIVRNCLRDTSEESGNQLPKGKRNPEGPFEVVMIRKCPFRFASLVLSLSLKRNSENRSNIPLYDRKGDVRFQW